MSKEKGLMITIIILAVSFLVGSFWISKGLEQVANSLSPSREPRDDMGLQEVASEIKNLRKDLSKAESEDSYMYLKGAADYLGLPQNGLELLLQQGKIDIPYIEQDGIYIFYKEALDEWMRNLKQEEYHIYQ
ncbi:hypothetical protein MFMK1_003608 [Metallumcola ferriviriculae]|uniref:Helix-turn-helix domain-containing protein n=1 Tax=Metallumcola ferriviriculae TaxID=3039180 RepID=A0AAU0UQZ5_9FIRM|nr:hypothetical protein MFMK1_003608 [Desulfitibacteraceae bacterium MK1]